MDGSARTSRLASLDGLRALAILLVVWHHSVHYIPKTSPALKAIAGALGMGWNGVTLFFVLSGFLIGGLAFREWNAAGKIEVWRFWGRRFFRTWPLYFLILCLSLLHTPYSTIKSLWSYFLFLQNWFEPGFLTHSWSLAVEEQFYLFFPLVFLVSAALRKKWIGWVLGGTLIAFTYWYRWKYINGFFYTLHTFSVVDALVWGVGIAWLYEKKSALLHFMTRFPQLLFIFALILIYGSRFTQLDRFWQTNFLFGGQALGFALLLVCALSPRFFLRPLLESRIARSFALVSYSMYLTHDHAVYQVAKLLEKLSLSAEVQAILLLPSVVFVSWFVAQGVYRVVELPALRLRDRIFPSRKENSLGPPHYHYRRPLIKRKAAMS